MQVRSLGGEDPLEERKAAHSWRILAWRIPPVPRIARDPESHLKWLGTHLRITSQRRKTEAINSNKGFYWILCKRDSWTNKINTQLYTIKRNVTKMETEHRLCHEASLCNWLVFSGPVLFHPDFLGRAHVTSGLWLTAGKCDDLCDLGLRSCPWST